MVRDGLRSIRLPTPLFFPDRPGIVWPDGAPHCLLFPIYYMAHVAFGTKFEITKKRPCGYWAVAKRAGEPSNERLNEKDESYEGGQYRHSKPHVSDQNNREKGAYNSA